MRDYPNMSYCMNSNTLAAMQQLLTAMQEGGTEFVQELSREERRAFGELFTACEEFIQLADEALYED